jgi:2-polyprenyl-6-methoxyphenol hydroxylase-like FAD-dependent oxidoreductase
LHDLITARFGPGITVRTGVTVTGLTQDASGVTITGIGPDAGDEEFRADLVIAADGIRSITRRTLHPSHEGPRYSGYTAYRGIAEADLSDGGGETWGRGQRFGFARLIDGRIYWYATANREAGRPVGPGGIHDDVTKLFGGWHEPIPALLAGTPPESVLQNDIYDLALPLVPFVEGRVVLLGDAAHAMTPNLGRGACSAIEDAGALARHLRATEDLPTALSRYDAERRPASAKLVKRSRSIGTIGQLDNRVLCTLRDGLLGVGGKVAGLLARRRRVEQSRV